MKTFRGELVRLEDRLREGGPVSLARFGDGELDILIDRPVEVRRNVQGREYDYQPTDSRDRGSRQALLASFRYQAPGYWVGISCPHCVGDDDFEWMFREAGGNDQRLTFSTLFFYSNYPYFIERVAPLFSRYWVGLVCHDSASLDRLPFRPDEVFRIPYNAWRDAPDLTAELRSCVDRRAPRGALFLFCAGPMGGILSHHLHQHNPGNSYLDIGSAFDPYFWEGEAGRQRRYLKSPERLNESCRWPAASPGGPGSE